MALSEERIRARAQADEMIYQQLLINIKGYLEVISPEDRVRLFSDIVSGYCLYCGRVRKPTIVCSCIRDE